MQSIAITLGLMIAALLILLYKLAHGKADAPAAASMTLDDQHIIERFARGDDKLRGKAIAAYRRTPKLQHGDEGLAHYLYMKEVDTVAPDLGWRQIQRQRLLESLED